MRYNRKYKYGERRCYVCKEIKPINMFPINNHKSPPYSYMCKQCKTKDGKKRNIIYRKNNIEEWKSFFLEKYNCSICKKEIALSTGNFMESIHFDHRSGGEEQIKISPTQWLISHPRNIENEEIFKRCNFGILCHNCNKILPTNVEDRKLIANNIYCYVFNPSPMPTL